MELKAFLNNLTMQTASIFYAIISKYIPSHSPLHLSLSPYFSDERTSYVLWQFVFLWTKEDSIAQIRHLGFGVRLELKF